MESFLSPRYLIDSFAFRRRFMIRISGAHYAAGICAAKEPHVIAISKKLAFSSCSQKSRGFINMQ